MKKNKKLIQRLIALTIITLIFITTVLISINNQKNNDSIINDTNDIIDYINHIEDYIVNHNEETSTSEDIRVELKSEFILDIEQEVIEEALSETLEEELLPDIREIAINNISHINTLLSNKLDEIASDYNCVSVSLAFFHSEYDFFTYQYGFAEVNRQRPVEEETKFRVASLSKYITALLAMTLVEKGELDLDDDISIYLGYDVRNPNYLDVPITSRMLMQHTSSIIDDNAYITARASFRHNTTQNLLNNRRMYATRAPGTEFEYSDFGFIVLGAICEKISGMMLDELAKEVLFNPLGIDAAYAAVNLINKNIAAIYNRNHNQGRTIQQQLSFNPRERGLEHNLAQGGLMISALDYAKIMAMLANDGVFDDNRILSEESIIEIHNTNLLTEFGYFQGLAVRYQDNVLMNQGVYWHTGSAYGLFAQFVYCRDSKQGAVVLTTGTIEDRESNGMLKICNKMIEQVWQVPIS